MKLNQYLQITTIPQYAATRHTFNKLLTSIDSGTDNTNDDNNASFETYQQESALLLQRAM